MNFSNGGNNSKPHTLLCCFSVESVKIILWSQLLETHTIMTSAAGSFPRTFHCVPTTQLKRQQKTPEKTSASLTLSASPEKQSSSVLDLHIWQVIIPLDGLHLQSSQYRKAQETAYGYLAECFCANRQSKFCLPLEIHLMHSTDCCVMCLSG